MPPPTATTTMAFAGCDSGFAAKRMCTLVAQIAVSSQKKIAVMLGWVNNQTAVAMMDIMVPTVSAVGEAGAMATLTTPKVSASAIVLNSNDTLLLRSNTSSTNAARKNTGDTKCWACPSK